MPKDKKPGAMPENKPNPLNKESARSKPVSEPVINIGALEPRGAGNGDEGPVINSSRRKMAATRNGSADKLKIAPPGAEPSKNSGKNGSPRNSKSGPGQTNSSDPGSRRSGNVTSSNREPNPKFHETDRIPALSYSARQEINGLLMLVAAAILFFGLLATDGVIAQVGLVIKRFLGIGAFLIPVLIFITGLTFFWEGLTNREKINQAKISAGVLMIVAFTCLLHLFASNPKAMAENGEGGGLLAYYLTGFLSGAITSAGTFFLLVALLLVGSIVAFNISLRDTARLFHQSLLNLQGRQLEIPAQAGEYEDYDPEDYRGDGLISNPSREALPQTFGDDELLDKLLLGVSDEASNPVSHPQVPVIVSVRNSKTEIDQEQPLRPLQQTKAVSEPEVAQPSNLPHKEWQLPKINILASFKDVEINPLELRKKARQIEDCLGSFGVSAFVREVNTGPTITQFALEPDTGVKVSKIVSLQNDLALALAAPSIRIEAPVPGQSRVGIEVPNAKVSTVGLRELMESDDFVRKAGKLKIALGRDVAGQPIVPDLSRMPHLLIAGSTGSGKSVCINTIIASFLFHYRPDQLQFIMIDPKLVELSTYNGIPHLRFPVVTQIEADPEEERKRSNTNRTPTVMSVLKWTIREMERRYKHLSLTGHRNLESYNKAAGVGNDWEKLPFLVLIIDELADLMMVAPEEAEGSICRLAQKARAVGIHLILATQRPSVDVVTGLIKANFPSRITFAVTSQIDSRVILDTVGAEKLLGRGDMLYLPSDAAKPYRVQGTYVSDEEIDALVLFWRGQNDFWTKGKDDFTQPQLWPQELREIEAERDNGEDGPDELFEAALEAVREARSASTSMLQRRLRVGYNRAARLIEELEQAGVIGRGEGSKPRAVLLEEEDLSRPTSLTAAASMPLELTPGQKREQEAALKGNRPVNETQIFNRENALSFDDDPPL